MTPRKKIHLVCNAHLDPVWQWPWEDGLTETLSTFRIAADFGESHAGFVFNHNEAVLYHWTEQHDPVLFARIVALVKAGRWHITGGAWLQPDVNGPSGESHIRQFLTGLTYFREKFGARPTTAYNFDPFGHPEGFQQVLAGCGMDSYIFCRPDYGTYELPLGGFRWRDRSGAEVITRRSDDHYLHRPPIGAKLDEWLKHFENENETMILWGIGNHGGGVTRKDYTDLQAYIKAHPEYDWCHSTPEAFFKQLKRKRARLPVVRGEIQKSFAGCYTSLSRVKRGHRDAESLMTSTERLCALAWWTDGVEYPSKDLDVAWKDILFSEFHDILPGSGAEQPEADSLALLGHAQENMRRLRLNALLRVLRGERKGKDGEVPIFVVNPHGFRVRTVVEVDYAVAHSHMAGAEITVRRNGRKVPFQRMKPSHNISHTWFVRIALAVDLRPWQVMRFDATCKKLDKDPARRLPAATAKALTLVAKDVTIRINPRTGLMDSAVLKGGGKSLVRKGAFCPILFKDLDHSWTCGDPDQMTQAWVWSQAPAWKKPSARFRLATAAETAALSPLAADKWGKGKGTAAKPIRITEDGSLCRIIEAVFVCGPSAIVRQYVFDKRHGELVIRDRILYNHKDHMLKLDIPLGFAPKESVSDAVYSAVTRTPTRDYEEQPNQRWVAVRGTGGGCIAVANSGSFAHNLTRKSLCINVMRSPAYTSFGLAPDDPWTDKRFAPRHDQGEHQVQYRVMFSKRFDERKVSDAAAALNTPPIFQVFYPSGGYARSSWLRRTSPPIEVGPDNVRITAVKKAEKGEALIVRVLELAGRASTFELRVAGRGVIRLEIGAYALKTVRISRKGDRNWWREVSLVEGL